MTFWAPSWIVTTHPFIIDVTLGNKMPPQAYQPTPNLTVSGFQLIWASILAGRPAHLGSSPLTMAQRGYRYWRITSSFSFLEPVSSGSRLLRPATFLDLDGTEKGQLNYAVGSLFAKAYSGIKLGIPWLAHLSLYEQIANVSFSHSKRPDYIGVDQHGEYVVAEAKGRRYMEKAVKDSLDRGDQTSAVSQIKSATPVARYGFLTAVSPHTPLQMYATDPPDTIPLELPPTQWIEEYYRSVQETITAVEGSTFPGDDIARVRLEIPKPVENWVSRGSDLTEWLELPDRLAQTYPQESLMPDLTVLTVG